MKFLSKLFGKGGSDPVPTPEVPEVEEPGLDEVTEPGSQISDPEGEDTAPDEAAVEAHANDETPVDASDPTDAFDPVDPFGSVEPATDAESAATPSTDPFASVEEDRQPLDGLRANLKAAPRDMGHHQAVQLAIPGADDRVGFYRSLSEEHEDEPYHSLSLGRAHRDAQQNREAVPHFQKYLRSEMDPDAFEELAEVYGDVGESYLATSARQIAESLRAKGG